VPQFALRRLDPTFDFSKQLRFVQSLARWVNTSTEPFAIWTCTRYLSNLISWIQRAPFGGFSIDVASAGSMKPGKCALDANRRFSH
jgi:hypothetical protein